MEEDKSLFDSVMSSDLEIPRAVGNWVNQYKKDCHSALIMLKQFFITACGCNAKITPNMNNMQHDEFMQKMQEEFDEKEEYPLIMHGCSKRRNFNKNFCKFIHSLVEEYLMYDKYLMNNLISFLTALCNSKVQAFRHTGTLTAITLITALVDVVTLSSPNFGNSKRQVAQRSGNLRKRALLQQSSMAKRIKHVDRNEIINMFTNIFNSIYVYKYTDTLTEIRAICMTEIGVWMKKFPEHFLNESYSRYIREFLHDKVSEIRSISLQSLLPLYERTDHKEKLQLLTSKIKNRIVLMTSNSKINVAILAMKLIISISKIFPDILTDGDCEILYKHVYSSRYGVRLAAAEFVNLRLFNLSILDMGQVNTQSGKLRLPNTPILRKFVDFVHKFELSEEQYEYLVDSFINYPILSDWACMTDLLLEEPGPTEQHLDSTKESVLIIIMVISIRQLATGLAPVRRGSPIKTKLSKKELMKITNDKNILTKHFIVKLPELLTKYQTDPKKLVNLLSIPMHFELEIYVKYSQEGYLISLLNIIENLFNHNTDKRVLDACALTLQHFCPLSSKIYVRSFDARSNIVDRCVNHYSAAIRNWRTLIANNGIPNEDDINNVLISLQRISILYATYDLNSHNLFDTLYRDIEDFQRNITSERDLLHDAMIYCIKSCYFSISWELKRINGNLGGEDLRGRIQTLKQNINKNLNACCFLVKNGPTERIQIVAYLSICDHLIACQKNGKACLVCKVPPEVQNILNEFVQKRVFSLKQEDTQNLTKIVELECNKRLWLQSYCHLIKVDLISMKVALQIFQHYAQFRYAYGDIIKTTLYYVSYSNMAKAFKKIVDSSQMGIEPKNFLELTELKELAICFGSTFDSHALQNLDAIMILKKLAKHFASIFNLNASKHREEIMKLHRAGICFAIPKLVYDPPAIPTYIGFLDILEEFTNILLKKDRKRLVEFLDCRVTPELSSVISENCQSLGTYRTALLNGKTDEPAPFPATLDLDVGEYYEEWLETDESVLFPDALGLDDNEFVIEWLDFDEHNDPDNE